MFKTLRLIDKLTVIALATTLLYVVANKFPNIISSFRFLWAPALILLIIIFNSHIVKDKLLIKVVIFGLFFLIVFQYTFWFNMSNWNIATIRDEYYSLFFSILLFLHYTKKSHSYAIIAKVCLIFIFVTVISTHFALFVDPGIVRDSANSFQDDIFRNSIAQKFGSLGYGYAQAIILLVPVIIYHLKNNLRLLGNRAFLYFFLILIILLILRAQVFANILVLFVLVILSVKKTNKRKRFNFLFLIIGGVILFISKDFFANKIYHLADNMVETSDTKEKLVSFADFLMGEIDEDQNQVTTRASRYPDLFYEFAENPILGSASNPNSRAADSGEHLYWMNRLTKWGIIGFIFFLSVLYGIYRRSISYFQGSFISYYKLSVLGFVLLGLFKNIAGREIFIILIFLIPGLYFLSRLENPRFYEELKQ